MLCRARPAIAAGVREHTRLGMKYWTRVVGRRRDSGIIRRYLVCARTAHTERELHQPVSLLSSDRRQPRATALAP